MDKKYIDAEHFKRRVMESAFELNDNAMYNVAKAICEMVDFESAADVAPVVHGDIERERIEAILKKHGTYLLSTIGGKGCHVGCYKGIALDADANWIIEADVESMSGTNCGDFIPVLHGEWISDGNGYYLCYKCSVCGWGDGYPFNDSHKFCPNCGAKMDGGGHGK